MAQAPPGAGALLDAAPSPRSISLGGAYGAVFGDEGSVFANPAGMAPIRHLALGVSGEESLSGARLGTAAGAVRVQRFTLGFGMMYRDASVDTLTSYEALGVAALAYRRGMLSIGVSAKGLREYAARSPRARAVTGATGTIGAGITFFDIAAFGFAIENLTGTLTGNDSSYALPRTVRGGFTINIVDPQGLARLMATFDWVRPPGGDAYWVLASETGLVSRGIGLVGRAGIATGRSGSDLSDASFGAGVLLRSVRVDYSSQGYRGGARRTHRIGVRLVL